MESACDPVDDFLCTRGTIESGLTQLRVYKPAQDEWEPAITIRGSHGIEQTTAGRHDGDIATTQTTWWITAITSTAPQLTPRPLLNSKIIACGKTWLILSVDPNPNSGRLFECQTQLLPES